MNKETKVAGAIVGALAAAGIAVTGVVNQPPPQPVQCSTSDAGVTHCPASEEVLRGLSNRPR